MTNGPAFNLKDILGIPSAKISNNLVGCRKINRKAMIGNKYNNISHPALNTKENPFY